MNKPPASPLVNRTMPSSSIIPVLVYPDVNSAITWLCQVFGFRERWRVGDHRAQLSMGNGTIAISGPSKQGNSQETLSGKRPALHSLLARVPNVMEHFEHVSKHGARILQPPADFPYGEKQYSVEDIGGHIWTFSQSIADVAPEDWGGTTVINIDLTVTGK